MLVNASRVGISSDVVAIIKVLLIFIKYTMQNDRWRATRKNLETIHALKGTVYTLGLLMGILTRLSMNDYNLYQEIAARAEQAKKEG